MEYAFELDNVCKSYGRTKVLDGANLRGRKGEVVAVLGENGAGKTTAIRTLLGFMPPEAGTARLFGLDMKKHTDECRQRMGYVSDNPALYEWMTIDEIGWFCAAFYDTGFAERYMKLIDEFELPHNRAISKLSRGMRARVALSLALAPEPELLVLDEPTAGLDPIVRREFLSRTSDFAAADRAVLIATHQIEEVERVADVAAILQSNGKFLLGPVAELKQRFSVVTVEDSGTSIDFVTEKQTVSRSEENGVTVILTNELDAVAKAKIESSSSIQQREPTLEEIYLGVMTAGSVDVAVQATGTAS